MSVGGPQLDPIIAALEHDYEAITPDAHVIATSLVKAKKKVRRKVHGHWRTVTVDKGEPKEADLASSMTGIAPDLTMQGASQLVLTLQDPTWRILDSGFFDADEDGRLDNLDVNYPDGSRHWWRLHQVSAQADHVLELTLLPRIVCELMDLHGPVKVNRAKRTRAEFLKSLCAKVKDDSGEIEFYSKQLDVKQKIGEGSTTDTKPSSKAPPKKAAKAAGIGANAHGLVSRGSPLTADQIRNANTILQVGEKLNAPHNALVACIYAAMGENNLVIDASNNGVFATTGVPSAYNHGTDLPAQAEGWFTGGTSFANGGGIKLANAGHPPVQIANAVEMNGVYLESTRVNGPYAGPNGTGDSYAQHVPPTRIQDAEAVVAAGGGAIGATGSTTIEVKQPYYFEVAKDEDYWAAMNRLAQEVGWELVVDGNRVYYDSDLTLIRQKVAAVVHRDDPTVLQWTYDWVNRHLATNLQLNLMSAMFEFHAGEVVLLDGFGPASTGSTAKLPGRWLINEIARSAGDQFSTLTLVQPTAPKKEPAPQVTTKTIPGRGGGSGPVQSLSNETPRTARALYAAAQFLGNKRLTYTQASRTLVHDPPQGAVLYDCSASVSWVCLAAGFPLPAGISWGGWAPVSGAFMPGQAGLQAGPGREMTIYANDGHVFIHIHPDGLPDMQGNTVNAGHGTGFCFFPWDSPGTGIDGGPSPSGFTTTHYPGT